MGDLAAIAGWWMLVEAADPAQFSYAVDANTDGQINLLDLEVLSQNWE